MLHKFHMPLAALLCCAASMPAAATCMLSKAPLANARIILKSQVGKTLLKRTTQADGKLTLNHLRPGAWWAQIGPSGQKVAVTVAADGTLSLLAETQTTSCHAPPHPNSPPLSPPSVIKVITQL
jgi:hypothetical protein